MPDRAAAAQVVLVARAELVERYSITAARVVAVTVVAELALTVLRRTAVQAAQRRMQPREVLAA